MQFWTSGVASGWVKSLFSFTLISKLEDALLLHSAAQTLTTRGSCSISCVINRPGSSFSWPWLYQFPQKHKWIIDLIISISRPSKCTHPASEFWVETLLLSRMSSQRPGFLSAECLLTNTTYPWGLNWESLQGISIVNTKGIGPHLSPQTLISKNLTGCWIKW